jgi:serine/threonine-protein kinase HipA
VQLLHGAHECSPREWLSRTDLLGSSSVLNLTIKASIRDNDGSLAIAKFPNRSDTTNIALWEAVALQLAHDAGINVTDARVIPAGNKAAPLLRRFDSEGTNRIPFLSAMSMLGAVDNEPHSYLEIADAIRRYGARPNEDCAELWRRIVFNILISNTDDHLRNHGFLFEGPDGWTLSPAYDLNPIPVDIKPRVLSTAIDEHDGTASVRLALAQAGYFGLRTEAAWQIAQEVASSISGWRETAQAFGLGRAEIDRMASAFEHEDLRVLQN